MSTQKVLKKIQLFWYGYKTRRKMARVFLRKADPFNFQSSPYEQRRFGAMVEMLGPAPFNNGLEVGCAEGVFTELLAKRCQRLIALDISATAVARAKQKNIPNTSFVVTDLFSWTPPPGTSFNVVVFGDVLYYLDKPISRGLFKALFPRVRSWLAPGARLMLAHGFSSDEEYEHRKSFRKRFELTGLSLVNERVLTDPSKPTVQCLLSVLQAPPTANSTGV